MEMDNNAEPPKSYEPFTIESFHKLVNDLAKQGEQRRKNGWKQEFYLSPQLAEELDYDSLEWLCKTYRVIGSIETSQVLDRKELEHQQLSK